MKKFLLFFVLALICALPSTAAAVDVADWADFEAAIAAAFAAGETSLEITLTKSITMVPTIPEKTVVPLQDPVSPDVKITELKIIGRGNTLTAPDTGRHFTITSGTLTFENVTLQGGTNSGGVTVSGGTATFRPGVILSGDKAALGGAVSVTAGTATFTDTQFNNNESTNHGGAVSVSGGTATFTGTQFKNNESTNHGGAVSVSGGTATFNGARFFDNKSSTDGGAVFVTDTGTADFKADVTMTGNTAKSGGAVFVNGGTANFTGTDFNNNESTGNGGAVSVTDIGAATFDGVTFSGNESTDGTGGAVYWGASSPARFDGVTTFDTNTAKRGGALALMGASLNATFVGGKAVFKNNIAHDSGGAIYDSKATISFSVAPEFTVNEAAASGGAIYAEDGTKLSFPNGTSFVDNKATGTPSSGGALYVNGGALSLANDITMTGNSANGNGGAVYAKDNITLTYITIKDNEANGGGDGGAVYAEKDFSATSSDFSENTAEGSGGAVYAVGKATLRSTHFYKNTASEKNGGAVYFTGETKIEASVFEENEAPKGSGGAILFDKNTQSFRLQRSYLKGNKAGSDGNGQGGAVCLLQCSWGIIEQTTFDSNISHHTTSPQGGAVYMVPTDTTRPSSVKNCTFFRNEAQGGNDTRGGALALKPSGNIDVICCTFTQNKAEGSDSRGGAIVLEGGNLTLGGSIVVDNRATHGKDIYNYGGNKIISAGYNRIGGFGQGSGTSAGDVTWNSSNVDGKVEEDDQANSSWDSATFFGAGGALAANADPGTNVNIGSPKNPRDLLTLKLLDDSPATDKIPANLTRFPDYDQRGVRRPQPTGGSKDIGAFEVYYGEDIPGGGDPAQPAYKIGSVRISGIPNTLDTIGQTTSLLAIVTYTNGTVSTTEKIEWTSSQPGVAWIDRDTGNIYTRSIGATTITATAARDRSKSGTAIVRVSRETGEYINIHRNVWNLLNEYNAGTTTYGSMMTFVDANPALVKASPFQTAFRNAWAANASQVTQVGSSAPITFSRNTGTFTAGGFKAQKGGARLAFAGRAKGDLLPMKYTWSFSWDELKSLLGRSVTKAPAASELFKALRVDFAPATGASNWNVIGSGGVSAEDAISRKALVVTETNNGVALTLTAYLANVNNTAPNGAKLINGLLVVPDGVADANLSGTMWLSQKATSGGGSGSGSSGEGGGGCDLGLGALALALAAAALLKRK